MKIAFKEITEKNVKNILSYMKDFNEHENIPFNKYDAKEALINLLENDRYGKAFNILADDLPAGYLIITFGYSLEYKGRDAFVDELFIDEDFRGKGLGTAALKFAEIVCRENGIKALHLEVEKENKRAQNVYRKNGFKDHERYLLTKWLTKE